MRRAAVHRVQRALDRIGAGARGVPVPPVRPRDRRRARREYGRQPGYQVGQHLGGEVVAPGDVCAGLTTRPRLPRPRVAMIVIDGEDQGIRRVLRGVVGDFYWRCHRRQPYITGGRSWFIGGATLHDSATLPFIQMADLVAHAGYQAISRKPERAFMHDWYAQHLLGPARAKGREIDVSETLLDELLAIDPNIGHHLLHKRAVLAS